MTATVASTATRTDPPPGTRRLTGLKPTGALHLGNLVGAIRPMVAAQHETESVVFLADLHALTKKHDPALLRERVLEQATLLLAAGVDTDRTLLYVQSDLPQHAELHYLLECATGYGEAQRMIQFQEGLRQAGREQVRLSLLTYPVLMAADILLHGAAEVPVGDDQTQHLELARAIATRFNHRYGETFVVPRAVNPPVAARLMDLSRPTEKMGKSNSSPAGTIYLLDPPDAVRRKVMRAVTDAHDRVRHDRVGQPGVANLLEILAGCAGGSPADLAVDFATYGALKAAVADAVVEALRPLRRRHAQLARDPGYVRRVLAGGAERARDGAAGVVSRARRALGLA